MPGSPAVVSIANGRKARSYNRKRQGPLANRIAGAEDSPIAVMYANMQYWCGKVEEFNERLQELIVNAENPEERREALTLLREFLSARAKSQECAVDLAPYIHPKLASINVKPMDDNSLLDLKAIPDSDALGASDAYSRILIGG